jgi:predicted metal-dependent hydrolase
LRTQQLAELYGFKFNKVSVKKLKSRWGSCSSKNNLSFNYKLMHFNTKVIDYVIVHELCHLIEMNHSKNFWLLVQKIIPDYKVCKRELSFYHQT